MSPHAANSLVHDLVQMAQAMEQLPQVQAQLDRTQGDLDHAYATIQRLELKLLDRATQIVPSAPSPVPAHSVTQAT